MKKIKEFIPEFVEFIPDELKEKVLYVSKTYETTVHNCFCGCRRQVVVPFSKPHWTITIDGDIVSLSPSIGSWQLPCKSHYFLKKNKVEWC